MPDAFISKITLPSGSQYIIKDETARTALTGSAWDSVAREAISGGVSFIIAWNGSSTPVPANIPKGIVVTYSGTSYTGTLEASAAQPGSFYLISTSTEERNLYDEYVPVTDGGTKKWEKLGTGSIDLSQYAKYGDSVTGNTSSNGTGISISAHSVTSATVSASGTVKPTGSNAASAVTIVPSKADVYSMTSAGSVSEGSPNIPTAIDTTKFSGGSFTRGSFSGGSGSFTQGQDVYSPTSYTVSNEVLTITAGTFTQGTDTHVHNAATHAADSFTSAALNTGFYTPGTANTPTAVTLPGRSNKIEAWTGYTSATAAAQTWSGDEKTVNTTGTASVTIANHAVTDNGHQHTVTGSIVNGN